jgi:hypothetical protein
VYRYLTIRSDSSYSAYVEATALAEFLCSLPQLQKASDGSFNGAPGEPWVSIAMVACDAEGNYAVDEPPREINVVELVCSELENQAWYDALAARIAVFLNWSAVEDRAARQVWPPIDA